jgi:transposase-like protein
VKTPTCRFCGSADIIKAGKRFNRNGKKQRWLCKGCGRRFTPDDGFLHLWYGKRIVTEALDLHYEGLSTRGVWKHFKRYKRKRCRPSWTTIWRWVQDFARKVRDFVVGLVPKLSGDWRADEMHVRVAGDDGWNWEVVDAGTRFWLASNLTEGWSRTAKQAETALGWAREHAKEKPWRLVTDGFEGYRRGGAWVIGWRRRLLSTTDWRKGMGPRNLMERKIQTTRMRVKTIRGFKGRNTGQRWLDGFRAHYNFVREHSTLRRTPAEAAGLNLRLGRLPWLNLISLSV